MSENDERMPLAERARAIGSRWMGIGLAAGVAAVTLGLGLTGQLSLYISPESAWYAIAGAVLTLALAAWSCTLRLGDEAEHDHGHDHGHDAETSPARRMLSTSGTVAAGVVATGVVVGALVLPPASLSVELALSRQDATGQLFAGADTPALGVADTSTFGIGSWSTVFATATRPESYDGTNVTLTGFVTPGDDGVDLTRMVITHCVIDAQPASVPVTMDAGDYPVGEWIQVTGTVTAAADGSLSIVPTSVEAIAEPGDPYEY